MLKGVELGFGSVEACQAAIGISCSECRYRQACLGDQEVVDHVRQ